MGNNKTPIQYIEDKIISTNLAIWRYFKPFLKSAKAKEKNLYVDSLIDFQLYLYNKGLINNHEWDFEKEAKKYYKKTYGKE